MTSIYLDHACTSFPKAPGVAEAVYEYMTSCGANVGRGCYSSAYHVEEMVYETRELLAELFGADDCRNVIFTKNSTEGLNVILKGFLRPGDHVLVSSMEHNAVMRPLVQLQASGVTFTRIPCDLAGRLDLQMIPQLVTASTRAIVLTHASNVCGTVLPLKEVGEFCLERGLRFIVDASQTGGSYPVHMGEMHIDALAFTGHKGLLGPQGIGGFILRCGMEKEITPLISGGTGSVSHTEEVPAFLPDRFEPGTMNLPGIIGLRTALLWLREQTIPAIHDRELRLTDHFLRGLDSLVKEGHVRIAGLPAGSMAIPRTGVVSIDPVTMDPAELSDRLDQDYGIQTRVGLHCAPSAHKTLGTFPRGTVRFSFGPFASEGDVDTALTALTEVFHGL